MVGEKERLERGREESNPVLNFWLELATTNPSHFLDMAQHGVKLTPVKNFIRGARVFFKLVVIMGFVYFSVQKENCLFFYPFFHGKKYSIVFIFLKCLLRK